MTQNAGFMIPTAVQGTRGMTHGDIVVPESKGNKTNIKERLYKIIFLNLILIGQVTEEI